MKLITFILISACMTAGAKGFTQSITLKVKDAPLPEVFKLIEKQTGYSFVYAQIDIAASKKVDLDVTAMSLEQVLILCFKNQPLNYTIRNKFIVVKPTVVNPQSSEESEKMPVPPIDIKGRIINENGEPVPANVIVKGTNNGTTANNEGYFELTNVDDNGILIVTGVSIERSEVKINGKTSFVITVKIIAVEGQDVIIKAGYYDVQKRQATGNISKVAAAVIEKQPVSNPLATLMGRVPGLEITQLTGVPGGNFKIRIRGTNSIANGNDPLFIIDGVPFISSPISFSETSGTLLGSSSSDFGGANPLNTINPLDIESIEVLKDADATAIYGSRGANGVILITTKKGKAGKTKVDFNFYTGTGKVAHKMEMLNLRQYLDMRYEAYRNDGIDWKDPNVIADDLKVWDTTRHTDWQNELIGGTAGYIDAQVNVSGGDQYTQFSLGGGYHRETTVFPGDNAYNRISTHASINNITPNRKLKTSLQVSYSSNYTDMLSRDLTSMATQYLAPNGPALYNDDGSLNWVHWGYDAGLNENPLAALLRPYESVTNSLIGNVTSGYSILSNLDLRVNLGYNNTAMRATNLTPASSLNPNLIGRENSTWFSNSSFQNWITEPQLNWRPRFGKNNFDLLAGGTFLEQRNEGLAQNASGFASEALMKNITAATNRYSGTNYYSQYRYTAFFGRLNYNFNQKYILNITGRRDGSSRFGPGKQFANFGSAGVAWVFSKENIIQRGLPFISFGKLRASYGSSGNDQIGDYQYLDAYTSAGTGTYQSGNGLTPARLSNPDFAWEINNKLEAALELGLLQDKIFFAISWYRNRSSSQLVGFPLAGTTGFTSIQGNFPATVQNTGVEIELEGRIIQHKEFSWTSSLNISVPNNKLIDFPNIEAFPAYNEQYVVGEPLTIRKLYRFTGLNTSTGLYEFEDVNGDGALDFHDQQSIQFAGQKFYGGFQNALQYKNFQLDFLFQFVDQTGYRFVTPSGEMAAAYPVNMLDRWQKPGDNTSVQRVGTTWDVSFASSNYSMSDQVIVDASFIRLKNLSLSWKMPTAMLQRIKLENARFFIQGQNLLTITKYKGLDPEVPGVPSLPPLRVLTAGFRLGF